MSLSLFYRVILTFCILGSLSFCVTSSQARPSKATSVTVGDATSVPYGWVDFCGRRPAECNGNPPCK